LPRDLRDNDNGEYSCARPERTDAAQRTRPIDGAERSRVSAEAASEASVGGVKAVVDHTVKAYDRELDTIERRIAEMGGVAEKMVIDAME